MQEESIAYVKDNGPLDVGEACWTNAGGSLKCKYVIHTVGPMYKEKYHYSQEKMLGKAVLSALKIATDLGAKSIAMPAISSGIFGFPKPLVAEILFAEVTEFSKKNSSSSLEEAHFTNFDSETANIFAE